MNIVNSLIAHLKKKHPTTEIPTPEGLCPNCWGRTDYGGQFYDAVANHGLDVNSKDPQIGWIQEYADKHLSGIQLIKHDNNIVCEKCKLSYKADSQ